jgi:putative acetyltransferase
VIVRPEVPADVPAIRAVLTQAFGRAAEADLVDALRGTPEWQPSLSLVAEDAEGVIGHVLLTDIALAGRPVLALGPIGVLPQRQGGGVGSALMTAAIEAARRTDRGLIALLGNPAYYRRFGFTPSTEHGVVDIFGEPPGTFQVLRLPAYTPDLVGSPEYPAAWSSV